MLDQSLHALHVAILTASDKKWFCHSVKGKRVSWLQPMWILPPSSPLIFIRVRTQPDPGCKELELRISSERKGTWHHSHLKGSVEHCGGAEMVPEATHGLVVGTRSVLSFQGPVLCCVLGLSADDNQSSWLRAPGGQLSSAQLRSCMLAPGCSVFLGLPRELIPAHLWHSHVPHL